MVKCLGCSSNDDCKGLSYLKNSFFELNEQCDPIDQICRPQCTANEDCKGDNMKCDTNKGLCVQKGKFQYSSSDLWYKVQGAALMMIAEDQMKDVTQLITFADFNVQQMKTARVTK